MSPASLQNVRCHLAGMMVPGSERIGLFMAHRGTCLRCQADQARQRRLERQLNALADVTVAAPAGLAARVMQSLDTQGAGVVEPAASWSWVVPALAAAGCAMAVAVARRTLSTV